MNRLTRRLTRREARVLYHAGIETNPKLWDAATAQQAARVLTLASKRRRARALHDIRHGVTRKAALKH